MEPTLLTTPFLPAVPSLLTKRIPRKNLGCKVRRSATGGHVKKLQSNAGRRRLLIGGLVSFGWLQSGSEAAEEFGDEGSGYQLADIDIKDGVDESLQDVTTSDGSAASWLQPAFTTLSLDAAEILSIFSIGTSIGIGSLAIKYRSKLEETEQDVKELLAKKGNLQAKVNQLNSDVVNKNKNLDGARKTITAQSKQIQLERGEVIRIDDELKEALANLSDSQAQAAKLTSNLDAEKKEASKRLGEAQGKIEALETKLVESQNISQERGLELERAQCELAGKLEEVDEAKNRIQKLESQVQSLEQSLVEERERIAILEGAREAAVQDIKGLLSEQRNLTFALKAESEMVSDLRASLDESKVEASKLKNSLDDFAAQSRSALTKLSTAEHELKQLRSAHEVLSAREASLNGELTEIKVLLNEISEFITSAEARCDYLDLQILEKEKEVGKLQAALSSEKKAQEESEAAIEVLKNQIEALNESAACDKKEIERLEQAALSRMADIQDLEQRIEKYEKKIADVQQKLDSEQLQSDILRTDLARKQEEVEAANQKLTLLTKKMDELTAQVTQLTGVERQLDDVTKEAAVVLEKLVVAERDCQELQTAQSKLKESESNMRAMREEVSALQSGSRSELRKVKMQLAASQSEVKELQNALTVMEQETLKLVSDLENRDAPDSSENSSVMEQNNSSDGSDLSSTIKSNSQKDKTGSEINSSDLLPSEEMVSMLGRKKASRAVAKVRADAVQIVEQIEDSAHEAIIDAKKAAKQSEKVAMKGLLAATTAEGKAERLQESLDKATKQISKKNVKIAKLESKITRLTADTSSKNPQPSGKRDET